MKTSELRNDLVNALRSDVATVTFKKKDGSERIMKATLQTEFMPIIKPADPSDTPKPERKVNEDVIAVFDTETNGFRSFRLDSVMSFFTATVSLPDVQGLIDA